MEWIPIKEKRQYLIQVRCYEYSKVVFMAAAYWAWYGIEHDPAAMLVPRPWIFQTNLWMSLCLCMVMFFWLDEKYNKKIVKIIKKSIQEPDQSFQSNFYSVACCCDLYKIYCIMKNEHIQRKVSKLSFWQKNLEY